MDDKQKTFTRLALGVGGLALAYALVNYLANRNSSRLPVSLERTRKMTQEVKYQMYSNCISFAEGVNTKLKAKFSQDDLGIYLRTEMAKLYEAKEELIISKYSVSRDEYAASLKAYKKDNAIRKNQEETIAMLERAVKGEIPDLTVPQAALLLLGPEAVRDLYKEVCVEVAIKVQEKLEEKMKTNPNFNPKDDAHFKKAIREVSIYDFKVDFLGQKGYRKEWGCPNEIFFKVLETHKQQKPEIKVACYRIEKGYEKLIDKVSTNPEELNRAAIWAMMNDHIRSMEEAEVQRAEKQEAPAANAQPASQPPKRAAMSSSLKPNQQLFGSIKPQAPPQAQAQEEEDDMEALMMKELLSRSQESPKASKKAPAFPATVSAQPVAFGQTQLEEEPEAKPEEAEKVEADNGKPADSALKSSELKKSLGVKKTDSMVDDEVEPSAEEADAVAADIANEESKPAEAAEPVAEATGPVVILQESEDKPVEVQQPKAEEAAPAEEPKPQEEEAKPLDEPVEEAKPVQEAPAAEQAKPAQQAPAVEEAKPEEEPKAAEEQKAE